MTYSNDVASQEEQEGTKEADDLSSPLNQIFLVTHLKNHICFGFTKICKQNKARDVNKYISAH